jgi:protein gp37
LQGYTHIEVSIVACKLEILDQCIESNVPFFFKQWGDITPKANGRTLDYRIWNGFPETIHHENIKSTINPDILV